MDLVAKPRCKSIVWQYFGLKMDETGRIDKRNAICRLCGSIVYSIGGSTTNLRGHLRRKHGADLSDLNASSTSGSAFDTPDLDSSYDKYFEDVPLPQAASDQTYIADAQLPCGEPWHQGGPSRAALSLPLCLCLRDEHSPRVYDPESSSEMQTEGMRAYTKCFLQEGVMFGPYVGYVHNGEMPASFRYAWAIRDNASLSFVDAFDENKSNWMRYVTRTRSEAEHNLVVMQLSHRIYYKVSQPITEGTELKVLDVSENSPLPGHKIVDRVKSEAGDMEICQSPQPSSNVDQKPVAIRKRRWQTATVTPAHVTVAITNFLIMDLQPPALIEGKGFKKLVQSLQPNCKQLPSHSELERFLKKHHSKGKASLVQLLRRETASKKLEETIDYTAPIEFEPQRRRRLPGGRREVPHHVTLSMDIWIHNYQGNTDRYFTLWAHYIDSHFHFQNFALETQKLSDGGAKGGLHAVEAQGRAVAQEWEFSQPFMILIGGEGRKKMKPGPVQREKSEETTGGVPQLNSTTFLEKDDSVSSEELHGSEPSNSEGGLPPVPCFFSAIRDCIEEVMAHPVISKALSQFQRLVSTLFLPSVQCKGLLRYQGQSLLQSLTEQEEAELKSWAHSRMMWNKLYTALRTLIKHKSLFCNEGQEIVVEESAHDANQDVSSESSSSGSIHANSTSSTSPSTWQDEWRLLEELCLVLKPLDVACRTLAKEAFPRLSLVKPILTGLLSRHLVAQPGESTSLLKDIKRMIRRRLESCYNNSVVNRTLCVACSLDPQFHGLGFMETKERNDTFDWLKKEAVRIVKKDEHKGTIKRGLSQSSPESESDAVRRSKRLKESRPINFRQMECDDDDSDEAEDFESKPANLGSEERLSDMEFLLGDLFCSTPQSKQTSTEECIDMEVSVFRNNKGTSLGADPLQWWEMKAEQLPRLAAVARAYLAAPAVAGNAAQEFMKEGVAYKQRANIPPESLDTLLFLHHNRALTAGRGQAACGSDDKNTSLEKLL